MFAIFSQLNYTSVVKSNQTMAAWLMHDGDNPVKGLPFLNGYLYGEFPNLVAEGASTIQTRPFIWSPENISTLVGLVKKTSHFYTSN